MSELSEFVTNTMEEHKDDLKKLEEFQTILKSIQKKEKMIYLTHEVVSNT